MGVRESRARPGHADPARIRLELLGRLLGGRSGWARTGSGWRFGSFDLVARVDPDLPYELWKGGRRVAALMTANHAIKVCEHVSKEIELGAVHHGGWIP